MKKVDDQTISIFDAPVKPNLVPLAERDLIHFVNSLGKATLQKMAVCFAGQ